MKKTSLFFAFLAGLLFCFTQTASALLPTGQPQGYVAEAYVYQDGMIIKSTDQYGAATIFINSRIDKIVDALGNLNTKYNYNNGVLDYTTDKYSLKTDYTNGRKIFGEQQDQSDTGQVTLVKVYFHYGTDGLLKDSQSYAGKSTADGTVANLIETTTYVDGRQAQTKSKVNGQEAVTKIFNWDGTNLVSSTDPTNDNSSKTVYTPDGEFSLTRNKEGIITRVAHFDAQGRRNSVENGIGTAKVTTLYDNMGREDFAKDSVGTIVRYWVYNGATLSQTALQALDADNPSTFLASLRSGGIDDGKVDFVVNVVKYEGTDKVMHTGVNRLERFNNNNYGISDAALGYHLQYEPAIDPAFTGTVVFQDGQFYLQTTDGQRLKLAQSSANHHGLQEGEATIDTNNWFSAGSLEVNGAWGLQNGQKSLESYLSNNLGKNITLIGNLDGAGNFFVIAAAK